MYCYKLCIKFAKGVDELLNLQIVLDTVKTKPTQTQTQTKPQTSEAHEAEQCQAEGHGVTRPTAGPRTGGHGPRCRAMAPVSFDGLSQSLLGQNLICLAFRSVFFQIMCFLFGLPFLSLLPGSGEFVLVVLFFPFHPPVLKPDLYLPLGES